MIHMLVAIHGQQKSSTWGMERVKEFAKEVFNILKNEIIRKIITTQKTRAKSIIDNIQQTGWGYAKTCLMIAHGKE